MRIRSWQSRVAAVLLAALAGVLTQESRAQTNLLGYWEPLFHEDVDERIPGPDPADYAGLPITAAARLRGDTWDADLLTLPEHQCKPHPSIYGFRGVGELRIWEDRDLRTGRLVKMETLIAWQQQHRFIWMDGRPHPSQYVAHTWQGFSTGHFEGDVLVVDTTHIKAGWIRRNGIPTTDQVTMEDRFYRHEDVLTHVSIVRDPVYLSEPIVRSNGFRLKAKGYIAPYPCRPAYEVPRERGAVPSHLPGGNPYLYEVADKYGIPREAMRGGAETALPEYADRIRELQKTHSGGDLKANLETPGEPQ